MNEQQPTQKLYSGISRKYELINEYVNDRIAQEITDIMHEQGNYIYSKTRGDDTSSYIMMSFLLEEFYQRFRDTIIASRSNGNINYLYDNVGKDNFEALNNLVNECYEKFGLGVSIEFALANYYDNKPTENASVIKDFIARRDAILDDMEKHMQVGVTQGNFSR